MYPDSRLYSQYGNTLKAGLGFGSNVYNSRNNGQWGVVDTVKYKPRGRAPFGFGSENQDGFTELNRGPRSGGFRHQKPFGPTVTIAVKGQALPSAGKQENSVLPDKSQFNQENFPTTYKDAKFFVIKSYSEDDVHKSIKYNVWASTPNGNKKLDAGYQEAQEKPTECPVFLFFSVSIFFLRNSVSMLILHLIMHSSFSIYIDLKLVLLGKYKWPICWYCRNGWSC
jgi:hypothetical protein